MLHQKYPIKNAVLKLGQTSNLAILIISIAFTLCCLRAFNLGIQHEPGFLAMDAIPPVLSKQYFNFDKNYATLKEVHKAFFGNLHLGINAAINSTLDTNIDPNGPYMLHGCDDKGIVDFVGMSFKIFGPESQSILRLYLTILGVSSLLFIVAFRKSLPHLLILAGFLVMFYLVMPSIKYNPQLVSILACRVFPILTMIATVHGISYILQVNSEKEFKLKLLDILLVCMQIVLVLFVAHIRIVAMWQLAFIAGLSLLFAAKQLYVLARNRSDNPRDIKNKLLALSIVFACVIASFSGLKVYRYFAFPVEYNQGEQTKTRVFWHNIYSGFAYHPKIAERLQLRIDDWSIYYALKDHLYATGRADVWARVNKGPEVYDLRWDPYDQAIKDFLIETCTMYPRDCLEAFLFYKPLYFFKDMFWLMGYKKYPDDADVYVSRHWGDSSDFVKKEFMRLSDRLDETKRRLSMFKSKAFLLLILPFFILLLVDRPSTQNITNSIKASALLFLGSLTAVAIGYPGPHTISDPTIVFGTMTYVLLGCTFMYVGKRLLSRFALTVGELQPVHST